MEYKSFVDVPLFDFPEIDNFDAFFIVLIKLNSSSPSINHAKFPCEKKANSFLPDFALTDCGLYA